MLRRPTVLCALTLAGCAETVASVGLRADGGAIPDAATVDDAAAPFDAGPRPPARCAVGWCWERPLPTGEDFVAAVASSRDRLTALTRGGSVVAVDGESARLDETPGDGEGRALRVTASGEVWVARGPETGSSRVHRRVAGAWTEVPRPFMDRVSRLVGAGDEVWAVSARDVALWEGSRWRVLPRLAGDPVIASALHGDAPGELLALESWGSGSGFGVLHRFRAGAWERVFDFAPLRLRADGALARVNRSLVVPAWDGRASRREVVEIREDGTHALFSPPNDSLFFLHGEGGRLFGADFRGAWSWDGARWTRLPAVGSDMTVSFAFASDGGAWALGGGVRRLLGEAWVASSATSSPSLGLWGDEDGELRLVRSDALAVERRDPAGNGRWSLRAIEGSVGGSRAVDYAVIDDDDAWVAREDALYRVRGERAERVAWPEGGGAVHVATAGDGLVGLRADGALMRLRDGAWDAPVPQPTLIEGYSSEPRAVWSFDGREVWAAWTVFTRAKYDVAQVFRHDGSGWSEVAIPVDEPRGVSSISIVGTDAFDVWIAAGQVYRWRGMLAEPVTDEDYTRLAVDPQGRVLGVSTSGVSRWSQAGAVETWPLPSLPGVSFDRVHASRGGAVRVSNGSAMVLRRAP